MAARMMDALENASLDVDDARDLFEEADGALVYLRCMRSTIRPRTPSAAEWPR